MTGHELRLRSRRIVTPAGTVAGEITVQRGRIAAVRAASGPVSGGVVDLGDRWVVPGFIDTHVHGGAGAQCNSSDAEEIATVARFHAAHGTTSLLATLVPAAPAELTAALAAIDHATGRATGGARVLGAHLEGPFLSPARAGALDAASFAAPDPALTERLLSAGRVTMMTLAPELPGALDLIEALHRRGVVVSLGHTAAGYATTRAAVEAGARSATHLFNAMAPLHHREPGPVAALLEDPRVSCELICDGLHVAPAALRLAHRAAGPGGVRLITDAVAATGMPDGAYPLGAATVTLRAGRVTRGGETALAGSALTMDAAVAGAVEMLGIGVAEAVALASEHPARVLGLESRLGSISPGRDADLAVLDADLRACATLVAGSWVGGGAPETD